jgi:hypothetical protein
MESEKKSEAVETSAIAMDSNKRLFLRALSSEDPYAAVERLLDQNVSHEFADGQNALGLLLRLGVGQDWNGEEFRPKILQLMLEKGVSTNFKNGRNAFALAEALGIEEAVQILSQHQQHQLVPEVVSAEKSGESGESGEFGEFLSALTTNGEALKSFLSKFGPNSVFASNGMTPLVAAVMFEQSPALETILDSGADINQTSDGNGSTALHRAASCGYTESVETLCKLGADLNILDKFGFAPVHGAIQLGHLGALEALCDGGADLGILDNKGDNLLQFVANRPDKPKITRALKDRISRLSDDREVIKNMQAQIIIDAPPSPTLSASTTFALGSSSQSKDPHSLG